jgi:HPt (histidine-containing phosphotransfer) domain-containing protein
MTEDILDPEIVQNLRDIAGDDLSFLSEMVGIYLKNSAEKIPVLDAAIRGANWKDAMAICHGLKSSSGNLGAMRASRTYEELEAAARDGNATEAAKLFGELRTTLPALESALRKLAGT